MTKRKSKSIYHEQGSSKILKLDLSLSPLLTLPLQDWFTKHEDNKEAAMLEFQMVSYIHLNVSAI